MAWVVDEAIDVGTVEPLLQVSDDGSVVLFRTGSGKSVYSGGVVTALSLPGGHTNIDNYYFLSGDGSTIVRSTAGSGLSTGVQYTGDFSTPTVLSMPAGGFDQVLPLGLSYDGSQVVVQGSKFGGGPPDAVTFRRHSGGDVELDTSDFVGLHGYGTVATPQSDGTFLTKYHPVAGLYVVRYDAAGAQTVVKTYDAGLTIDDIAADRYVLINDSDTTYLIYDADSDTSEAVSTTSPLDRFWPYRLSRDGLSAIGEYADAGYNVWYPAIMTGGVLTELPTPIGFPYAGVDWLSEDGLMAYGVAWDYAYANKRLVRWINTPFWSSRVFCVET